MKVNTRLFGEMDVEESKIINIEKGIVGFPDLKLFTLIFDAEKDNKSSIMWLQSLDEPEFALPVMIPNDVVEDYNPTVNDDVLEPLGKLTEDNLYVLVTVRVPKEVKDMSINLKAPIVINTDTLKGGQIIVEDDLDVRFPIYEILQKRKEGAGE